MSRQKYWMKRKRYGWGWTPTTWQGWLFITLQAAILMASNNMLYSSPHVSGRQFLYLAIIVGAVAATIVLIVSQTVPSPRWRWGWRDSDNPDEDF